MHWCCCCPFALFNSHSSLAVGSVGHMTRRFSGHQKKTSVAHVKVSIQVYRANAPLTRNFLRCTNKREGGGSQIWDCFFTSGFTSYLTLYSSYCYSPTGPDWIRPGMVTWRTLSSRNGFCCKNFLFPITPLLTPPIFWTDDVRKYFHAEISTAKRKSPQHQVKPLMRLSIDKSYGGEIRKGGIGLFE